jgi:hypothetical protein
VLADSAATAFSIVLGAVGLLVATASVFYAKRQTSNTREQLAVMQRPIVIPITPGKWWLEGGGKECTAMWVKNGGPGAALNVQAILEHPPGVKTYPQALGPGDTATLAFERERRDEITTWDGVKGVIAYESLEGMRWATSFTFTHQGEQQRVWASVKIAPMPPG